MRDRVTCIGSKRVSEGGRERVLMSDCRIVLNYNHFCIIYVVVLPRPSPPQSGEYVFSVKYQCCKVR